MDKSFNVLFVSSEVLPFSKESGVGDVAFSLPLAIKDKGNDVRVMMPKYGTISERKNRIHDINRLKNMEIPVEDKVELATVKSSSINNPRVKVQAYITTNDKYFNQVKGVYHDPQTWKEYPNNAERFIFFSRSVIETCNVLGWYPDIIHCNDWHTAIIPALAKVLYPVKFENTKTVLTIHNFLNQGCCDEDVFALTELPEEVKEHFMHNGKFNILKGGIHYADYITTVSKSYADDVMRDESYSDGLSLILKEENKKFKGILNGVDNYNWNPKKDKLIKQLADDIEDFKYRNKEVLCDEYGFEYDDNTPLLIMIPRIGDQKGVPLIIEAADELFSKNIQMILLGQGDIELKKQLDVISKKYPDKFKTVFSFDNELAHKLEAGADIFIMPSKSEPCGLNLMYSLNYGTVPVVRLTGGTKEIATQFEKNTGKGDSFTFTEYSKEDFLKSLDEALEAFQDKELWEKIMENGINKDFSWDKNVNEYIDIYKELLK